MLGYTRVRALSVLDVCSRDRQKQALQDTYAQIDKSEADILQILREVQVSDWNQVRKTRFEQLLQDRKTLLYRLAWLKLDSASIAQYRATGSQPTVKSDPIFMARMAAYRHPIEAEYVSETTVYDDLLAEGVISLEPQVTLFTEPNYPEGQGTPVFGYVANWSKPIGSLQVSPGSAVTLFSEPGFWGNWHVVATDVPNFCNSTRLNLEPGQPVGSLMVYSLCNLPYTGGWIISLEPYQYLSARQSEILRVSNTAGPWEVFRLDMVETLGPDHAKILLSVDNVTPSHEFVPGAVRAGDMYILTEQRDRGYRRFTLADLTGRPVVLDNMMLRIGTLDEEPVLMTRAIKVAKNESEVGMLRLGEVALYEHANYWGRVWVVHETHGDMPDVAGLNDSISSIRLGPYTGATLYRLWQFGETTPEIESLKARLRDLEARYEIEKNKPGSPSWPMPDVGKITTLALLEIEKSQLKSMICAYQIALLDQRNDPSSKQDITEDVPNLAEAPSGADATINLDEAVSSIRVWTLLPPDEVNIEYTCKLSQDYRLKPDGKTEEIFAYRSTLKFDQSVEEVTLWATDATTIEVAGKAYTVDEDQGATISLPMNKQLVVITEARDICTPALKIRTSAMPEDTRAVIFPDREVHQRLANLEEDELWEAEVRESTPSQPTLDEPARKPLINREKFNKEQIANAQKAIKTAMSSIAYAEPGSDEVLASTRYVSARAARDAAWMLDFGAPQPPTAPMMHPGEAMLIGTREPSGQLLDYQPLDEHQLGAVLSQTLAGSLQQSFWGWLKSGFEFIWDKVIVAPVQYIWDHAKDFGEEVIDGLKEFGTAAWGSIKDFGDKLVAFLVNAAGEVAAFVLDTAEKVVAVVKTIVEKIAAFVEDVVEAIKKFIEFLAFLFNWKDILRTQEILMAMFNEFMANGQTWITKNRPVIKRKLQAAGNDFKQIIFPSQAGLIQDMESDGFQMPSVVQDTIKVIGEVQEKIDWVMDKLFNIIPSPQLQLVTINAADQATLRNIAFSGSEQVVSAVGSVATGIVEIFDDGFSPQQMLAGVLKLLETLVDTVLNGAIEFIDDLLEITELLLRVLSNTLNHEWYVPILSEIYDLLTGEELSILSVTALVLAVPLTLATKLTIGEKPFASGRPSLTLPDLSEQTPARRTPGLPAAEALGLSGTETGLPGRDRSVFIRPEGALAATEDRAASIVDRNFAFELACLSGIADTTSFLLSIPLDAYPPKEDPKGIIRTMFEFFEASSVFLGIVSFMANLPGSIVVDYFDEYEDKPSDVKIAAGFKWGIEAVMLILDLLSVAWSDVPSTGDEMAHRARRSELGFWAVSCALGIGHLTAVSCMCGLDDDMEPEDVAAEVLMSIPGPLALLRNEWLAENKYVWIGCAVLLTAGNLGGAAGSIISMVQAAP